MKQISLRARQSDDSICRVDEAWQNNGSKRLTIPKDTIAAGRRHTVGLKSDRTVERKDDLCIHCKLCNKACPVNINVEKAVKVTSAECINCNECVLACPKKGALEVKIVKKTF